MFNRLTQKSSDFFRVYPVWLAPFSLVILLRITEYLALRNQIVSSAEHYAFLYGIGNDLIFILSLSFILFLPTYFLWLWKPGIASRTFAFAGCIVILANALFNRYFITTNSLLGADLFGYSIADIKTTVGSSTTFSAADLFPLLLITGFLLVKIKIDQRKSSVPVFVTTALLAIGLISTFQYNAFANHKTGLGKNVSVNKTAYFISANYNHQQKPNKIFQFADFPLAHQDNSKDVLSPFFNLTTEKPNIVLLIVEGLGRDFTGPAAMYKGFTPFLDSLSEESLYWTNFVSTAGRSFAGLPSILGSLPYATSGFNELGQDMPDHLSLVRILKQNGYATNFFYGGNANFDKQDIFLERQGIDYILDENKFGGRYKKDFGDKYSWGFADGDLYKRSLEIMGSSFKQPSINIYFTLSTHEPFAIPNENHFAKKVEAYLSQLSPADQKRYSHHKDVWKSLAYSDESIRSFISAYQQRPDYANTIFIITGDHRLIPVQEDHALSRYHVPLMIYSPMINRTANFKSLASHLDITPSLLKLLERYPDFRSPTEVHWMGKGLDTLRQFNSAFEVPLMRNKNSMDDYIALNAFISGNDVYHIEDNLQLKPVNDKSLAALLKHKLDSFRQLNTFVCSQKSLTKTGFSASNHTVQFTNEELTQLAVLSGGFKEADTLFMRARRLAFGGDYSSARLLCRKILEESPNYHDVRVLFGRTYSWDKQYQTAIPIFKEVVRRNPDYEDAYLAWIDTELWSGKKDSAFLIAAISLKQLPNSQPLREKHQKLMSLP